MLEPGGIRAEQKRQRPVDHRLTLQLHGNRPFNDLLLIMAILKYRLAITDPMLANRVRLSFPIALCGRRRLTGSGRWGRRCFPGVDLGDLEAALVRFLEAKFTLILV